jgi:predicted MFS family arabinose efflux permease
MGLLLIAVTTSYPLALLAVAAAGIGEGPQLTGLLAVRHREAPDDVRAQIFTTGASLKIAGFAVGAGIAGPLANWSLRGCLLVAAGVQVLAVLTYLTSGPARPRVPRPTP